MTLLLLLIVAELAIGGMIDGPSIVFQRFGYVGDPASFI